MHPLRPSRPRKAKGLCVGLCPKPSITADFLPKRGLDLRLQRNDVARELAVDAMTVNNWERGRTSPARGSDRL